MSVYEGPEPMFPRGVVDPFCPSEHVITESIDRRLLWHIEGSLSVNATTDALRDLGTQVRRYLNQTCEHHWHDHPTCCEPPDAGCLPPIRQCLWCNTVEDLPGTGGGETGEQ